MTRPPLPTWLQTHLQTIGAANPDQITRTARLTHCRHCHTQIVAGLDADRAALPATVDLTPLSTLGEALALLTGRPTYTLRITPTLQVDDRHPIAIRTNPADQLIRDPPRDVVPAHRCRTAPLPTRPTRLHPTRRNNHLPADTPPPY